VSEIPPIPPGFKIPPNFNDTPIFDALYKQMEREVRRSKEIGGLALGREALFFLTAFQPLPGSDYVAERHDTPIKTQVFRWLNRTQHLLEHLAPYFSEVRRDGTPEQLQILHDILKKPLYDEDEPHAAGTVDDGDDDYVDIAKVDSYPEPAEAITILERIAQGHPTTSVEYLALQITIRALQYLIESGEGPEFMRYVDQMSKWVPAPDDA